MLAPHAVGVRCTGGVQHPLNVRVTALDPVARGAVVRLVVSASSAVALDQVEVRLTSTGGAANLGSVRSSLGSLDPGQVRQALRLGQAEGTIGRDQMELLRTRCTLRRSRLSRAGLRCKCHVPIIPRQHPLNITKWATVNDKMRPSGAACG